MATVYSLLCWGGSTGNAVTASAGNVITLTRHGLQDGTGVQIVAGTCPSGLSIGTTYYAKSVSTNTFSLYSDSALTSQVTFSSGGSSLVMKSLYLLGMSDTSRWGGGIYGGLAAWLSGRSGALPIDLEVGEIGMAWTDQIVSSASIALKSAKTILTSTINGVRTGAFHDGEVLKGYILQSVGSMGSGNVLNLSNYGVEVDGITVQQVYASGANNLVSLAKSNTVLRNCVLYALGATGSCNGVSIATTVVTAYNNLIVNCYRGVVVGTYTNGAVVASNTVMKCSDTGFYNTNTSTSYGYFYDNLAIGNGTNWGTVSASMEGASNNAGLSTDATWTSSGAVKVSIATTDFANYGGATWSATDDYHPASASSPQVDTGLEYYGILPYDLAGDERPNYNNGDAEAVDIGCYEYDHGYGNHPATATISLTNIVSGSRVLITRDDTSAVLYNDVPGSSLSFVTGYIGNFSVVIRKASESPYYREFSAGGTTVADQTTSIKALQQLDE